MAFGRFEDSGEEARQQALTSGLTDSFRRLSPTVPLIGKHHQFHGHPPLLQLSTTCSASTTGTFVSWALNFRYGLSRIRFGFAADFGKPKSSGKGGMT
jgi:hypothetical protein